MMRMVLSLVAGCAVAVAAQTPPDTRNAPRLRIAAAAVDRRGDPVADLRPNELEVWIGSYRVPIETVTFVTPAAERSRTVILLLDDLTQQMELTPRIRDAARAFVKALAPDDRMAVVALDSAYTKLTDDRAQLTQQIDRFTPRMAGILPFERLGEHVLGTLAQVSRALVEDPGRKIFVGIGSGWLFDTPVPPPMTGRDLRRDWIAAVRAMAAADATLYVIDPGGVGQAPFATGGAVGFARETGGFAFMNTNDYAGAADRIMRETSTYYVLEVADPPVGRNAELRELDVRVLRKGVTIRARRWLTGGKPTR
jgi:VWFA-related protein